MSRYTFYHDLENVIGSHSSAVGDIDLRSVEVAPDVAAVDGIDPVKRILVEHVLGAVAGLFGGLPEQDDITFELVFNIV